MQMEPWRKRGFVPDSDEEDEFDSLGSKASVGNDAGDDIVNLEYIPLPEPTSRPQPSDTTDDDRPDERHENGSTTFSEPDQDHNGTKKDAEKPGTNTEVNNGDSVKLVSPSGTPGNGPKGHGTSSSLGEQTPNQHRVRRTYGKRSSSIRTPKLPSDTIHEESPQTADKLWDIPSSPVQQLRPRKPKSHESTPSIAEPDRILPPLSQSRPEAPDAEDLVDLRSSRSSSPDEINVVLQSPKRTSPEIKQTHVVDVPQQHGSEHDSPLSSPPSSLHSPREATPAVDLDVASIAPPHLDPLDTRLPTLEEPTLEELLEQASDTAQREEHLEFEGLQLDAHPQPEHHRTFRKRKPQQKNPYTYEMAVYLQQCRESGTKPSRAGMQAHIHQQKTTQAANESQEQDSYEPNANRSSPAPEEWLPPIRPERQRERDPTMQTSRQSHQHGSPLLRTQSHKRRKKSHPGDWNDNGRRVRSLARPEVVINHTPPRNDVSMSLFDMPSSPPRSGSVSSSSKTPRVSMGFRYPQGLTPPPTTTTGVDSHPETPREDGRPEIILVDSASASDADADSDDSQNSADLDEDVEERQSRLMQRRIRGVLPASWVRIDAQQRLKQQKASQQNRHAAVQRADGKGVAKKIVRKSGHASGVLQGLMDLGDSDESDEENPSAGNVNPEHDVNRRPANSMRLEDAFDRTGEVLEDNTIDYMLPTFSRTSEHHQRRQGLKRVHPKETAEQKERRLKKARLKRQTRLTDNSYGNRRVKTPRRTSVPRLGILDAPDVASKPRTEQPQFLRIAARRARSRQDGGRQSPTRKFLQLGSKHDTADANESLRDWTKGAIRQATLERPQPKPRKRQSLASSSIRRKATPSSRNTRIPQHFREPEPIAIPDDVQNTLMHPSADSSAVPATPTLRSNESADAHSSNQPERRGNDWIVRRNVAISSLRRNNIRPAAASMAGPNDSQAANKAVFGRSLNMLNRDYRQTHPARVFKPSLTLNRYLSNPGPVDSSSGATSTPGAAAPSLDKGVLQPHPRQCRGRLKKKEPKRINLDTDDSTLDAEPLAEISGDLEGTTTSLAQQTRPSSFSVGGLFNWQRSYTADFAISPLRDGTFFHESTFIGSGEFSRSLHVLKRNLDHEAGYSSILIKDRILQWGPWNEVISDEMQAAFAEIIDDVEKHATSPTKTGSVAALGQWSLTYRSIIKYVTDFLTFIDPVDRTNFVKRAMSLISKLRDPMIASTSSGHDNSGVVRTTCYNMVFANQLHQIASHDLVESSLRHEALDLVKTSAKDTLELTLSDKGITEIHQFLNDSKTPERRDKGFRDEFPCAEASIIAQQLLRSSTVYSGLADDLHLDVVTKIIARKQRDVCVLETGWRGLFAPLPLMEVDGHGIARRESRFKFNSDKWKTVKQLLSPALDDYKNNSAAQPISYNVYCRTLFQRCHRLITLWGWRECNLILETLYDFFAQKTLYNLKLEESRGSPAFLDELDRNPPLDIRNGEPCFHTLLKIIASGLRFLSERYNVKKIRNIAYRLLPNHGRVYPKEQPLRHEDLDALRNHHDLLCTVYWAVPDGSRPGLKNIRDLVHPASSHREACSISIRSWTRLVRFKLSTKEDVSGLEPFADWHSYFLSELRQQHSHARKEIEAQSKGDQWASKELIESTISQNQRQIESLLSMALSGMRTAVELAPSLDHAHKLISKMPLDSILGLFNPKLARVNVVVSEALQVIVSYTQKDVVAPPPESNVAVPAAPVPPDEDSQEFGDWTGIDDALVTQDAPVEYVQEVLHPVVSRFVSNCFGADDSPDDTILASAVDCWTSLAHALVRHDLKRWDNYLGQFGNESWTRLRDTLQTRKFAPQFLAACIEKDARILVDCRVMIMSMWFASLVERSSMMKFQHLLTAALMNGIPNDRLLQNLPFTKDKKTDRYNLTLEELSQRRLSLLSSLLSNMREHVLRLELSADRDLNVTKQDYAEMLQRLMTAMKDNYRELGNGAAESAQGAYVDFVHRIIRFLQELTSDIRPVDPFFTDPALFPLPSSDPRYIVAKLKRYEPKLFSNRELVTLTGFIQGITERALIEGQQCHLVDQLHMAMRDTYEAGRPDKPTLRSVLMRCVFPAYLELAFSSPPAWLLSWPIVQSTSRVFKDLLFNLDATDSACVASLLAIFDAVFQSTHRALRSLCDQPSRFKEPVILYMLTNFLEMISSSLGVVDYIDRLGDDAEDLVVYVQWFRNFGMAVNCYLRNPNIDVSDHGPLAIASTEPPSTTMHPMPQHLATARRLAFEDHRACLRSWASHDGKYYHTRAGHGSKEIALEPALAAVIESDMTAKNQFQDAAARLTSQIQQLELLSPYKEPRDVSITREWGGGDGDDGGLSDIYSFLRLQ